MKMRKNGKPTFPVAINPFDSAYVHNTKDSVIKCTDMMAFLSFRAIQWDSSAR